MNLTEQYRARALAFIIPQGESPAPGWKGYAFRATILAIGFGTYILLCRKKESFGRNWNLRRSKKTIICLNDDSNSQIKDFSEGGAIMTYNGEICPICLGAPKIGVKAPCGHLLCADCLASYCDVRITPAPPPCPLCRAPLNSVALACDFTILNSEMIDPNVADNVQHWIHEYNNHRGLIAPGRTRTLGFLTTQLTLLFNILTLFLIIGLIVARLQVLSWMNWTPYTSVIDIALAIALIICVWFKNQAISYE